MKVKIKRTNYETSTHSVEEQDVDVLFRCNHVEDTSTYSELKDVKFCDYEILIVKPNQPNSFGYSCLWSNSDGTYSYGGLGHSGACSIITALLQELTKNNAIKENIKQFLEEYSSCNNRCTRFPYYWTIADEEEKYEPCEGGEYVYDYGYAEVRPIKDVIQDIYEGDSDEFPRAKLMNHLENLELTFEEFKERIGTYKEDTFELEDILEDYLGDSVNRLEKDYETYYEGMFLTQKDAEEYLESCRNHHFGPNPRTYLQSFNEWGRSSRTETFIKELFEYFNVPEPPELYYKNKEESNEKVER